MRSLCGYNPYCGPSGVCFRPEGLLLEKPYWEHISESGRFITVVLHLSEGFREAAAAGGPGKASVGGRVSFPPVDHGNVR